MNLVKTIVEPLERVRQAAARGLARLGVTAEVLTLLGLPLSVGAGGLFALGHFRWAATVLFAASACDALDGAVARVTGRTSKFGAFVDSTIDRYSDAAVLGGILVHYLLAAETGMVVLTGSALVGSLLVSYARARAECFIESCKVGFFERGERLVTLMCGAVTYNMPAALWILGILTHWTVIVRIHHTWRTLAGRPVPPANTFTGQLYHIVFWDFERGSLQYDIAAIVGTLCILFLRS